MRLRLRYLGTWMLSLAGILTLAAPADAARITIGEADGGSIVWDGSSDVSTMNVNPLPAFTNVEDLLMPAGTRLFVDVTVTNDADNSVDFNVLRLFLSVNSADANLVGAEVDLISLEEARLGQPPYTQGVATKPFEVPTDPEGNPLVDINAKVVAYVADFVLTKNEGNVLEYSLSDSNQLRLDQLIALFPAVTFQAGLGVVENGNAFTSCEDSTFNNCDPGTASFVLAARAVTPPNPVPEPSTLLLLGTGLVASRFARRRRNA